MLKTYTGENHMVIGLDAALNERYKDWPVDDNGEPLPECRQGSGQACIKCGGCDENKGRYAT